LLFSLIYYVGADKAFSFTLINYLLRVEIILSKYLVLKSIVSENSIDCQAICLLGGHVHSPKCQQSKHHSFISEYLLPSIPRSYSGRLGSLDTSKPPNTCIRAQPRVKFTDSMIATFPETVALFSV
jgi:hypothetical protein